MIEQSVSLASNGVVKVPGYEQLVRFGYTKNRGVYRLAVTASGEWEGLAIRCFWHVPDGKDPASSLVDGYVDVPASVTAQPGNGCITFEGSNGTKTVTSADLRYRVSANSGTEDGTEPEPGTPAWQELVDAVHTDATAAEQAKTDAQTAAQQAGASAEKAGKALSDTITAKEDALKAIGDKQTTATQAVDTARDKALQQVETSTEAAQTAANEAATSADKAAGSEKAAGDAQAKAAESLQELKEGIASGNFKGEPGTSPTVTVQDIAGGHRIVITDATGTSSVDVMDGKQGDPGKDATVDATLSQSGKAADAKVTGDALATKAVIDDTAVGADAWSSKHIIDTLCPPLEESGNPVQCYPVAGYPLGCKVSWEPVQEGSGEPSPDNVRPIKGRDNVTVTRCGENCFDFGHVSRHYVYTVDYEEKTITVPAFTNNAGYVDTLSDLCPGIIPGIWTISADVSNPTAQKLIYILNTSKVIEFGNPYTFTSADLASTFSWYNGPDQPVQNVISDIQVTYGSTAPTTYAPYTGQTAALTLPRTIYGGTVDAVTGEGQETWQLIDSYAGENLPGKWISDRDVYASGTAPTTGAQVAHKLAEPISFAAAGAQPIPALSGVNTILTDADSAIVTGRADPIKRITDLEDAVASMT